MNLTRFTLTLKRLRAVGLWLSFVASIICLASLVLYGGIYHTPASKRLVLLVIEGCQVVFIVNILYNIIFLLRSTQRNNRALKWILDIATLITALPLLYPHPENPWIPWLEHILYSHWFVFTILGIYSVFEFSYGVSRLLGRRTNPSLLLASSFLFFIIIGALILMLPRCTYNGISFVDSLFVATSAVSITGLTTVDISQVFTPFGIAILAILIQIGALGVLTFTSFFALFFSGNTTIYNQLMVKDMIYSKKANALLPTLLYVFLFTLTIEIAGAVGIYLSLPSDFPLDTIEHRLLFSGFQSLSAFCNAGFTWLQDGMSNPTLMGSNQSIYVVVGTLVMLGGIGFPILVNVKNIILEYFRRLRTFLFHTRPGKRAELHLFDVNTKVVLITSLLVTVASIGLFLLFEWNNTLAGMDFGTKLAQSYFNAFVPRSSGFASVNPADFMPVTLIMTLFLMWMGGSSQSTAGGIKINTFAAMLLNLKSVITEKKYITVFKRTISVGSIRRANAVVGLSILSYFIFAIILVGLEPELSVRSLLFEAASALFTVGSSLGITPDLCVGSKMLLCVAMFIGRVGLLSLLMGLATGRHSDNRIFPYDNIIIN